MDDLQRSIIFQISNLNDPLPVKLQHILIIYHTHPKIYLHKILLSLQPYPIQLPKHPLVPRNKPQQNVLPYPVALIPGKSQNKRSSLLVMLVLPDRFDLPLE